MGHLLVCLPVIKEREESNAPLLGRDNFDDSGPAAPEVDLVHILLQGVFLRQPQAPNVSENEKEAHLKVGELLW